MSLWEEQDKASDNSVPLNAVALLTQKPQDWVIQDYQYERALEDDTKELIKIMSFSGQLTKAAFLIVDYVPNLEDTNRSAFWKVKVIPTIVESLTQDVKARNALIHAMASVRDLAITIHQAATIVKATHGSQKAIEIAQKNIPAALEVLERAIVTAESLENSSIALFKEHAQEFFDIIGPKAADFAKQKEEIETQILRLETGKQQVIDELAAHKGELEKYSNLVHAAEARVSGADNALEGTRLRCQKMQQLNEEAESSIKAISNTVTQTTTTHHSHPSYYYPYFHHRWWWWGGRPHSRTTTSTVSNPDREAQKKYYEGVIAARASRIKEGQHDIDDQSEITKRQNEDLAELKGQFKSARTKYEVALKNFPDQIKHFQEQIDVQRQKITDLDKDCEQVETTIGLRGATLIECLVAVRAFTRTHKDWTQMYAPLASALRGLY